MFLHILRFVENNLPRLAILNHMYSYILEWMITNAIFVAKYFLGWRSKETCPHTNFKATCSISYLNWRKPLSALSVWRNCSTQLLLQCSTLVKVYSGFISNSLDSYSGDILLALNVNGNSVCLSVFMCVTTFAVMHQALQKKLFWKFINKKQYFDLIKGV